MAKIDIRLNASFHRVYSNTNGIRAAEPSGLQKAKWCSLTAKQTTAYSKATTVVFQWYSLERHAQTECKCYRGKKVFPPDSVGREESGLYEILNRLQNIRGAMSHFHWIMSLHKGGHDLKI